MSNLFNAMAKVVRDYAKVLEKEKEKKRKKVKRLKREAFKLKERYERLHSGE